MLRGRTLLRWLLVLLVLAVPALLTDLECMVGQANCCACQEAPIGAATDDCSTASLAAAAVPVPCAPPRDTGLLLPAPPAAPAPKPWGDSEDQRAPREGPPPLASGLRAPPA